MNGMRLFVPWNSRKEPAELLPLLNAGPADNEQIIRKGLALGADDAIRIDMQANDAFQVAAEIAAVAKKDHMT